MTFHITGCDSIYLHAIIKESHSVLSIDLHLGFVLDSIPMLKGIRIQEESLSALSYTLGASSWGVSVCCFHLRGQGSLLWCCPHLAVYLHVCSRCSYQWAVVDEVLQTATMITALLFHFGILHSPHKAHHEFLHDPVDTIGVFAFHFFILHGTLLLQVCQAHSGCFKCWLGPLELPQGEETSHPGFGSVIGCLASWASG